MVYISSASTSAKRPIQLPFCSREREQDKALEASEAREIGNSLCKPTIIEVYATEESA